MWQLLKALSIGAFLISGVFVLYGLVKVGRAGEAATSKPSIESGVPGMEITRVESTGAAEAKSQAMTILVLSGLTLTASVVVFGYAKVKGNSRPNAVST
jgi:hypothetical protein